MISLDTTSKVFNRKYAHLIAYKARKDFEGGNINPNLLKSLYWVYNPLKEMDAFIAHAAKIFPKLN